MGGFRVEGRRRKHFGVKYVMCKCEHQWSFVIMPAAREDVWRSHAHTFTRTHFHTDHTRIQHVHTHAKRQI